MASHVGESASVGGGAEDSVVKIGDSFDFSKTALKPVSFDDI